MEKILNITNGDCAVEIMKKANIPGELLPWHDVLHDGPVPADLSLEELSKVRAKFIVERGWGTPEEIEKDFLQRDNTLKSYQKYGKIILWFEHDLYDQLQILQILDWFHNNLVKNEVSLSIICTDKYLGMLSADEMCDLFKYEELVTEKHLILSHLAWKAFRSSSPEPWSALMNNDTSPFPFLGDAILRMLEEYPSSSNGLSRTAQQALKIISEGEERPLRVFCSNQELEKSVFLGDSSFWFILQELLTSAPPLLKLPEGKELSLPASPDQKLTITREGRDILSGKRSWIDITKIDRWIGGGAFDTR